MKRFNKSWLAWLVVPVLAAPVFAWELDEEGSGAAKMKMPKGHGPFGVTAAVGGGGSGAGGAGGKARFKIVGPAQVKIPYGVAIGSSGVSGVSVATLSDGDFLERARAAVGEEDGDEALAILEELLTTVDEACDDPFAGVEGLGDIQGMAIDVEEGATRVEIDGEKVKVNGKVVAPRAFGFGGGVNVAPRVRAFAMPRKGAAGFAAPMAPSAPASPFAPAAPAAPAAPERTLDDAEMLDLLRDLGEQVRDLRMELNDLREKVGEEL